MLMNAVWIFVMVMGGVFALAFVSQLLKRGSPALRKLCERYPPQQPSIAADKRSANVFLSDADDPKGIFKRRGCLYVGFDYFAGNRNAVSLDLEIDDEYFHARLDGGAGGANLAMSVPWATIELEGEFEPHVGTHLVAKVDEVAMFIPAAAVAREILNRRILAEDLADDPFA